MNDISAILAKIDADARQYAQAAQAAAEQKAEAIREDYRRQAEAEAARAAGEARRQAEAIRQRAVSQAGIEARNSRLAARREAIDSAFQRAMERLCAMPEEVLTQRFCARNIVVFLAEKIMKGTIEFFF